MSKDRLLDEEDHKSFHAKLQMNCQVDVTGVEEIKMAALAMGTAIF